MNTILFVDDELNLLDGIRDAFHGRLGEWKLYFAQSGADALDILSRSRVDIIVSDMQMPGMDGIDLLAKVRELHPDVARFLLTGQADRESIVRASSVVHQFVYKPCSSPDLAALIERTCALHERIESDFVRNLVSRSTCVPSAPKSAMKIARLLASGEATLSEMSGIIERDAGLAVRVLRVANSAVFARPREITTVSEAVSFIGFECAQSLAAANEVFQTMAEKKVVTRLLEATAEKAFYGAALTAKLLSGRADRGTGMTATLLRDVGLLVSANAYSQIYQVALNPDADSEVLLEVEKTCFGATHAEIGGHLLALWGLSWPTVDLVTCHHSPRQSSVDPVLMAAVHVSDVIVEHPDSDRQDLNEKIDWEFVDRHRLDKSVDDWLEDHFSRAA